MKIKIKRVFRYQASATKVKELQPGVYDVGGDISKHVADSALKFGSAELVVEAPKPVIKAPAPENKVVESTENKARVAKAPVRRRRSRSRSDAGSS